MRAEDQERHLRRALRQRDRLLRLAREMRNDLDAAEILGVRSAAIRRARLAREIEDLTR